MRVLDEVDLSQVQLSTKKDVIKEALRDIFWNWYEQNKNDKITKISILGGLWKRNVYVKDLKVAFILLFGPQ